MRTFHVFGGCVLTLVVASVVLAQQAQQPQQPQQAKQAQTKQAPQSQPAPPQPAKKPVADPAIARLTSAKNVMVTRDRGSQIPYDVISSTLDGWGRFTLVDAADKADLVITVGTTGGDNSVRVSGSSSPSPFTGVPEQSTSSTKEFSSAEITMTVYDAKTKRALWTAVETAKSAMKQTARENNLVEAAEKLAKRFHDRLEPPPKQPEED